MKHGLSQKSQGLLMTLTVVIGLLGWARGAGARDAGKATLEVRVTDATSGRPTPCRITVVDGRGAAVPLEPGPSAGLAVRPGVAYSADGRAVLGLAPGTYVVYASRGFEYGVDRREVTLEQGVTRTLDLAIRREVPTPGLVACDTHVHTATYSGHGDATVAERVVTLAGEGVELPVATDHDHLTDLSAAARAAGVAGAFTPVVGDEVTTRRGHFNAFPFAAGEAAPDSTPLDRPALLAGVRGKGQRLVVMNHPRSEHSGYRPFGPEHFNDAVGEDRDGAPLGVDAVEVINAGALQTDPMRVVSDWFALWNHGSDVTAVGASDSHDVSRSLVGQARTYVACRDDDPGRLDVGAACRSLREGRAVVSFGLLARLTVDDKFGPGDLATGTGATLRVRVEVLGPSWVTADRVALYANGIKLKEEAVHAEAGAIVKARVEWTLPKPSHDVAIVAVASGPGGPTPFWPIVLLDRPTPAIGEPRVLSVTNPVRVDADGDGTWNSPRYYAQYVIEIFGTEPSALVRALGRYDEAVATQAAAFCQPAGPGGLDSSFASVLGSAPEPVRRGFAAFESSQIHP